MCHKCGSCGHISDSCNRVENCVNFRSGYVSGSVQLKLLEDVQSIKIRTDRSVFSRSKLIVCNLISCQRMVMHQLLAQVLLGLLILARLRFRITVLIPVDATNVWEFVNDLVKIIEDGSDISRYVSCQSY